MNVQSQRNADILVNRICTDGTLRKLNVRAASARAPSNDFYQ